jgi:hypothetical protein
VSAGTLLTLIKLITSRSNYVNVLSEGTAKADSHLTSSTVSTQVEKIKFTEGTRHSYTLDSTPVWYGAHGMSLCGTVARIPHTEYSQANIIGGTRASRTNVALTIH